MTDFGSGSNDAGGAKVGSGCNYGSFMNPNLWGSLGVIVAQGASEIDDQILDPGEGLPGILKRGKVASRNGVVQIVQFAGGIHEISPFSGPLRRKIVRLLYYESGGMSMTNRNGCIFEL